MDREAIFQATLQKFLAPVADYLHDEAISEVMINGPEEIFIERNGMIERTEACFASEEKLLAAARNIAQYTNKRITPVTARFDSRLPDGSRVHVVLPRCSRKGLCISIRKFRQANFSLADLVEYASLSPEAREYIEIVVALERNLLVSGGTGSGKTSLLNAISRAIPATERIVVIEDSSELRLQQPHVLSFETAWPDRHGEGAVSIRDLFHSALRMRPDRIVIGECRGGEALDLIQAMTSGHGGSMSTLHATTPADALHRLETMALMAGVEIPLQALRMQIASAIDVIVQVARLADGRRVITEIAEVESPGENHQHRLSPIFERSEAVQKRGSQPPAVLRPTGRASAFGSSVRQHGLDGMIGLCKKIFVARKG